MYDDYDDYLDDYNDQLDELEEQEQDAFDSYESELEEIDDYWDRENEYIRNSGIYSEDEVNQILEEHNRIRKGRKEDAHDQYEFEKDMIRFDREQVMFNRQMAEDDREFYRQMRELEETEPEPAPIHYPHVTPLPERPSFLSRLFSSFSLYYLIKKVFG